MRILIAGASGLVGKSLTIFLQARGHTVIKLSRTLKEKTIVWSPEKGELNAESLEGFDAIINLAGEGIADGRWTAEKKQRILNSRVASTKLLATVILRLKEPPKVFINASAIGFYGDQRDRIVDETSAAGESFLSDVCMKWEEATAPIKEKGVRVALLRTGIVLSKKGGTLAKMLTPFSFGLGGRIGSGCQYMSWVSLNDLIHIIEFTLKNDMIEGPVNAVSPRPVTNEEFTKTLGKVLKRPTWVLMPAFLARLIFGEMADELLLASTRVHPAKLQQAGYSFCEPTLEGALRKECAKS